MRAIGYLRVSTTEQASSGLGLEAQRASIEALARRRELDLAQVESDEGVSGSSPAAKRPGLSRALERLARGDALLAAQPDRLGRDLAEGIRLLGELRDRGVVVICANGVSTEKDDDVSWLTITLLLVLAEFQLRQGRTRTRAALSAKRARGERVGAVPFGFELGDDGLLKEDLEQLRALGTMQRLRREGMGYRAIARELTELGIKPRGAAWRASSVRSILATAERRTGG